MDDNFESLADRNSIIEEWFKNNTKYSKTKQLGDELCHNLISHLSLIVQYIVATAKRFDFNIWAGVAQLVERLERKIQGIRSFNAIAKFVAVLPFCRFALAWQSPRPTSSLHVHSMMLVG